MKKRAESLKRGRKGFTLIELLIVIAILAILAIIVIMNLSGAKDKANYAKAKDECSTIYKAMVTASVSGSNLTVIGDYKDLLDTNNTNSLIIDKEVSTNPKLLPTIPKTPFSFNNGNYQVMATSTTNMGVRFLPKAGANWCEYENGSFTSPAANCMP